MKQIEKKARIDEILLERGFSDTLKNAQALIMSGVVLINERKVVKPSEVYSLEAKVRIKGKNDQQQYVGRGGIKLEEALNEFHIHPNGYVCLDIGSSTGGFTDCLLQKGASRVVAVDAGTNQLAWKLRNDSRVEVRENTNARHLKAEYFAEKFDLIVMDVSFISVTKIYPALSSLLKHSGKIIVLVKPQFEADKDSVEQGGIVRDPETHKQILTKVNRAAEKCGLKISGIIDSPILGATGNKEFLVLYDRQTEEKF